MQLSFGGLHGQIHFCWTTQATLGFLRQSTHASVSALLSSTRPPFCNPCNSKVTESHVHNIFAVKLADSSHQVELLGFPSICKVHYKSFHILCQNPPTKLQGHGVQFLGGSLETTVTGTSINIQRQPIRLQALLSVRIDSAIYFSNFNFIKEGCGSF
ncbi:hypothetical protein CK203_022057 [Vitis vinifera]|uniref:Uncharacterized protein n=1 Tax=Vitis vinifera TaxID=29760 RepID=A0A438FZV5_VITVI|nr:hypothetical protein CK203_022057 [Vitis vinifera]